MKIKEKVDKIRKWKLHHSTSTRLSIKPWHRHKTETCKESHDDPNNHSDETKIEQVSKPDVWCKSNAGRSSVNTICGMKHGGDGIVHSRCFSSSKLGLEQNGWSKKQGGDDKTTCLSLGETSPFGTSRTRAQSNTGEELEERGANLSGRMGENQSQTVY